MPIALDPEQVFPIMLKTDEGKENAPKFLFPAVTIRTQRRIFELANWMNKLDEKQMESLSEFELMDKTTELFNSLIAGWENVNDREGNPIPFSIDATEDILTTVEQWELLHTVRHNGHLNHEEKKS